MPKRFLIVSAEGCPACERVKHLKPKDIEILDYFDDPSGTEEILEKVKTRAVPFAVKVQDGRYQRCGLSIGDDGIELNCNGEIHRFPASKRK